MIILKMILYLIIIMLILLDVALAIIIWYFAKYKQTKIEIKIDESEEAFRKAKEIIKKEGTD